MSQFGPLVKFCTTLQSHGPVLSRIAPPRLLELIRQGKVHAGMTRSEAESLVGVKRMARAINVLANELHNRDLKALAVDYRQFLDDEGKECSTSERLSVLSVWIAKLSEALKHADKEHEAGKAKRKANGKEQRLHA